MKFKKFLGKLGRNIGESIDNTLEAISDASETSAKEIKEGFEKAYNSIKKDLDEFLKEDDDKKKENKKEKKGEN